MKPKFTRDRRTYIMFGSSGGATGPVTNNVDATARAAAATAKGVADGAKTLADANKIAFDLEVLDNDKDHWLMIQQHAKALEALAEIHETIFDEHNVYPGDT